MSNKKYISTTELAKSLGISRIAVFNMIKKGEIKAEKIGRNYAIPREIVGDVFSEELSNKTKKEIDQSIGRFTAEYGEILRN